MTGGPGRGHKTRPEPDQVRSAGFAVRFTPAEHDAIRDLASKRGVPVSAMLRDLALAELEAS